MSQTFLPGTETWYASDAPSTRFSAIFEDDCDTGYFYAYDREKRAGAVLDAVHIYNVANVTDRHRESIVAIIWTADGLNALLLLNDYPHAVIDFDACCTYSRRPFPWPSEGWRREEWDDAVLERFRDSAT